MKTPLPCSQLCHKKSIKGRRCSSVSVSPSFYQLMKSDDTELGYRVYAGAIKVTNYTKRNGAEGVEHKAQDAALGDQTTDLLQQAKNFRSKCSSVVRTQSTQKELKGKEVKVTLKDNSTVTIKKMLKKSSEVCSHLPGKALERKYSTLTSFK